MTETGLDLRTLVHVAIGCARNSPSTGRFCAVLEDTVQLGDIERWYAEALAVHAWTVDGDGNAYCPRHNPADIGARVTFTSECYMPIGDSGWEARAIVPEGLRADVSLASIEIRQRRGGDG